MELNLMSLKTLWQNNHLDRSKQIQPITRAKQIQLLKIQNTPGRYYHWKTMNKLWRKYGLFKQYVSFILSKTKDCKNNWIKPIRKIKKLSLKTIVSAKKSMKSCWSSNKPNNKEIKPKNRKKLFKSNSRSNNNSLKNSNYLTSHPSTLTCRLKLIPKWNKVKTLVRSVWFFRRVCRKFNSPKTVNSVELRT